MTRHVYLGWDPREVRAYDVAEASIRRHCTKPQHLVISPLRLEQMRNTGFLYNVGEGLDDVMDDYSPSTEFSRTRFLIPFLQDRGWALYADCDIVALADVEQLFQLGRMNPSYAVMCVKHRHISTETLKMDGRKQIAYDRKNWSSVLLFNCEHPSHRRLNLDMVNRWPRRMLHQLRWLEDDEIGELPAEWNVLVGIHPMPEAPKILHYTLGHPGLPGWKGGPHDDIWHQAAGFMASKAA